MTSAYHDELGAFKLSSGHEFWYSEEKIQFQRLSTDFFAPEFVLKNAKNLPKSGLK